MTKKFHIGDVLSVTTGRLVSFRHISGVYDIMNYVLQDSLTTIGIAAMADTVSDELKQQFPQLDSIEVPEVLNEENFREWIESLYSRYGEFLEVTPMKETWKKQTAQDDIDYAKKLNPDIEVTPVVWPNL
jgi:hypothetical protein